MKHINKRVFSLLLCLALVMSYLPSGFLTASAEPATVAMETARLTDPSTIDQWKQFFGTQTNHPNRVTLSTEFAGGVWTDKSVFTPDQIPQQLKNATYKGKSFPMTDKGDNFLVALSGMASNKQIKGYSTIPTDTVLILDLSNSMDTGEITVFDFDNCMYCWYMFDLANLWIHGEGWFRNEPNPSKRMEYMQLYFDTILKGYRTETNVDESLLEKLPLFIDMVLVENIVDEFEVCAREGEEMDPEDIEDAAECLINHIPYAGIGE